MQALVTAPGNTAIISQVPIPAPGPNEILVKVHSIALNPVDALYVAHPVDKPGRVVGTDIAGTVQRVGKGVDNWSPGDRVAGILQGATSGNYRPGGFAEYAVLEADLAIRIPSVVSFDEAATLPLCSLTAAQALFIRLDINPPFPSPFTFSDETGSPALLIYSAATSLGLFTIELAKTLRTSKREPYRLFATASPKNHESLLAMGVEAVFDYRSSTWVEDIREVSGGITHAVDCISEDDTTAKVSQTFRPQGGKIAVIRQAAWNKEEIRDGVKPLYGAAWAGLGHEIKYNDDTLPASASWRAFTVAFFKYLSADPEKLPIAPNPVRLMPGGLSRVVPDAFRLIGAGKVVDRESSNDFKEPWMKPISAEKLVYRITASGHA